MSSATDTAVPRPSSTVVLLRDGQDAPELFLVKRHRDASFGGAFVFPGGVIDDTDCNVREYCRGVSGDEANRLLAVEGDGIDYYVAAIRELFEETGVLLADSDVSARELDTMRRRLNASSLDWCDFVLNGGLLLRCDALHYFSHWITPDILSKRFSTRFFVARLPGGQIAEHDDGELVDAAWFTAAAALDAAMRNEVKMHFPTIKTLEQLAAHSTVDGLIAWAQGRASAGVTAIQPVMRKNDEVPQLAASARRSLLP